MNFVSCRQLSPHEKCQLAFAGKFSTASSDCLQQKFPFGFPGSHMGQFRKVFLELFYLISGLHLAKLLELFQWNLCDINRG